MYFKSLLISCSSHRHESNAKPPGDVSDLKERGAWGGAHLVGYVQLDHNAGEADDFNQLGEIKPDKTASLRTENCRVPVQSRRPRRMNLAYFLIGLLFGIMLTVYWSTLTGYLGDCIFGLFLYVWCSIRVIPQNPPV